MLRAARRAFAGSRQPFSSFINSTSSSYIDAMYSAWKADKNSVHLSWQLYFENPSDTTFQAPPTLLPSNLPLPQAMSQSTAQGPMEIKDHMQVSGGIVAT